jgi:hypothetical protein
MITLREEISQKEVALDRLNYNKDFDRSLAEIYIDPGSVKAKIASLAEQNGGYENAAKIVAHDPKILGEYKGESTLLLFNNNDRKLAKRYSKYVHDDILQEGKLLEKKQVLNNDLSSLEQHGQKHVFSILNNKHSDMWQLTQEFKLYHLKNVTFKTGKAPESMDVLYLESKKMAEYAASVLFVEKRPLRLKDLEYFAYTAKLEVNQNTILTHEYDKKWKEANGLRSQYVTPDETILEHQHKAETVASHAAKIYLKELYSTGEVKPVNEADYVNEATRELSVIAENKELSKEGNIDHREIVGEMIALHKEIIHKELALERLNYNKDLERYLGGIYMNPGHAKAKIASLAEQNGGYENVAKLVEQDPTILGEFKGESTLLLFNNNDRKLAKRYSKYVHDDILQEGKLLEKKQDLIHEIDSLKQDGQRSTLSILSKDYSSIDQLTHEFKLYNLRKTAFNEGKAPVSIPDLCIESKQMAEYAYSALFIEKRQLTLKDLNSFTHKAKFELKQRDILYTDYNKQWKEVNGFKDSQIIPREIMIEHQNKAEMVASHAAEIYSQDATKTASFKPANSSIYTQAATIRFNKDQNEIAKLSTDYQSNLQLSSASAITLAVHVMQYREVYGKEPQLQEFEQLKQLSSHHAEDLGFCRKFFDGSSLVRFLN